MNTGYLALIFLGIITPILFTGSKDLAKEEKISNILIFVLILLAVVYRTSKGGA